MKNLLSRIVSKQEAVELTLEALRPVLEDIYERADKGEAIGTKKMLMRRMLRNHNMRFGMLISKKMMSVFDQVEAVPVKPALATTVVEEPVVVDSVDFDDLTPEQQADVEKQVAEDLAIEVKEEAEAVKETVVPEKTSLKEAAKQIKKKKAKKE